MVAPNSDGVSRPALTGRNQSIKTTVQRYQAVLMNYRNMIHVDAI